MTDPGDVGASNSPSGAPASLGRWQRGALGGFFLLMGTLIGLAAMDIGPMADAQRNAPGWLVATGGLVFLCSGGLLLFPSRWLGSLLAGGMVALITLVFGWVAISGDSAYFVVDPDGLLSATNQVLVARVIFALVAVLGMAIVIRAWFWHRRKRKP